MTIHESDCLGQWDGFDYSEQDIKDNTYSLALKICCLLSDGCLVMGQETSVLEMASKMLSLQETITQ